MPARRVLTVVLLAALVVVPMFGVPDASVGAATARESSRVQRTPPTDACGVRPKRADGSHYACTFRDDFGGTRLDRGKWMVAETRFSAMYGGGGRSCYVDNDRTVRVSEGLLRLTSTMLPSAFRCQGPHGFWLTRGEVASVTTRSLFTQTYGRFEARIKMPAEAGVSGSHSAFWLYPQEFTYGRWPSSGEVDIAEWFSAKPQKVYPSVHYRGERRDLSTGHDCAMPTSSTAFHTYAVEWTPSVMRFLYDGRLCFTHAWKPSGMRAPKPFDKPFYLVLTQVWGLGWNHRYTAQSPTRSTLTVDWVKVWK